MIPSRTACSMIRTRTARLFFTVERLHSSAIHACTVRSTEPFVIMRTPRWPREGTRACATRPDRDRASLLPGRATQASSPPRRSRRASSSRRSGPLPRAPRASSRLSTPAQPPVCPPTPISTCVAYCQDRPSARERGKDAVGHPGTPRPATGIRRPAAFPGGSSGSPPRINAPTFEPSPYVVATVDGQPRRQPQERRPLRRARRAPSSHGGRVNAQELRQFFGGTGHRAEYRRRAVPAVRPRSCCSPSCRKIGGRFSRRSPPRFIECLFPGEAVGDDVQETLCRGHVVGVTGGDGLPHKSG